MGIFKACFYALIKLGVIEEVESHTAIDAQGNIYDEIDRVIPKQKSLKDKDQFDLSVFMEVKESQ